MERGRSTIMRGKNDLKTLALLILYLFATTGCPATTVSRVTPAGERPPDVKLVITLRDDTTGKTEIHQVVSPQTSGDVTVKVNVPPPPLPPDEAKGIEVDVKAIATDPAGVSHLRIMRTAAPGVRWKSAPPGPINRFADDAKPQEELQGTLVLLQKGATIELFAEALNFRPADSGHSQTANLIITTK